MRRSLQWLTSNWRLKLAAFALATMLWVVLASDQIATRWLPVPVDVDVRDPALRLSTDAAPQEVDVRFTGPGRELWELALSRPRLHSSPVGCGWGRDFSARAEHGAGAAWSCGHGAGHPPEQCPAGIRAVGKPRSAGATAGQQGCTRRICSDRFSRRASSASPGHRHFRGRSRSWTTSSPSRWICRGRKPVSPEVSSWIPAD